LATGSPVCSLGGEVVEPTIPKMNRIVAISVSKVWESNPA